MHELITLCEMIVDTNVYNFGRKIGIQPVPGIMTNSPQPLEGEGIIMVTTLKQYLEGARQAFKS